jgi:23S rRNA pseudouridine2605 synthase
MVRPMSDQKSDKKIKPKGERIAKVLARAGVGSRRGVEALINEGRISLGGKVVETPATLVLGTKGITFNGRPIKDKLPTKLWLYHKPKGLVTTHKDEGGRDTVFQNLPEKLGRVISVGRLDLNTEGLLMLTNDGGLSRWMELPQTAWKRKYKVRVHGKVNENKLLNFKNGITLDGVNYGPIDAHLERVQNTNAWISIVIKEGKNREIRKVMEHIGLKVTRLIRTAYGPYELGNMKERDVAEVSRSSMEEYFPRELIGERPKVIARERLKGGVDDLVSGKKISKKPNHRDKLKTTQRVGHPKGKPTSKHGPKKKR